MQRCATPLGLNADEVFRCARLRGPDLQNAAAGEAATREIHFAPTVFLNGEQVKSITVADVCKAYKGVSKPAACKQAGATLGTPALVARCAI